MNLRLTLAWATALIWLYNAFTFAFHLYHP